MKKSYKKLILVLTLIISAGAIFLFNKGSNYEDSYLDRVEPQYVCMINNKLFDNEQILVEVDGKKYYGCCPMCKAKLEGSKQARMATDPVSGEEVDKAEAVIGADIDGKVYYFENEANFSEYDPEEQ
jgi:YHS domain-containing protein